MCGCHLQSGTAQLWMDVCKLASKELISDSPGQVLSPSPSHDYRKVPEEPRVHLPESPLAVTTAGKCSQ